MRLPLLFLLTFAPSVLAQQLPHTEPCRSELEARLAFGLCDDGTFDFYASGSYRPDVPRPDSLFGYPIGSWHTTYGRMERYLDRLAEAVPERVRVFDYGRSIEQRTMHLVAISSENIIGRLDSIQADLQRLADPRGTSVQGAESMVEGLADCGVAERGERRERDGGVRGGRFSSPTSLRRATTSGRKGCATALLVLINLAHNPESHRAPRRLVQRLRDGRRRPGGPGARRAVGHEHQQQSLPDRPQP